MLRRTIAEAVERDRCRDGCLDREPPPPSGAISPEERAASLCCHRTNPAFCQLCGARTCGQAGRNHGPRPYDRSRFWLPGRMDRLKGRGHGIVHRKDPVSSLPPTATQSHAIMSSRETRRLRFALTILGPNSRCRGPGHRGAGGRIQAGQHSKERRETFGIDADQVRRHSKIYSFANWLILPPLVEERTIRMFSPQFADADRLREKRHDAKNTAWVWCLIRPRLIRQAVK